jgi:hypothetical protein
MTPCFEVLLSQRRWRRRRHDPYEPRENVSDHHSSDSQLADSRCSFQFPKRHRFPRSYVLFIFLTTTSSVFVPSTCDCRLDHGTLIHLHNLPAFFFQWIRIVSIHGTLPHLTGLQLFMNTPQDQLKLLLLQMLLLPLLQ